MSICSAIAVSAAVAGMAGPTQAADAIVAVPKAGAAASPMGDALLGGMEGKALVVQDGFSKDEKQVVVVTPTGNRIRAGVRYWDDGSVVIPLDGQTALLPTSSIEPVEYSRDTYDIYRVYDCNTITSQFEKSACDDPKTQ